MLDALGAHQGKRESLGWFGPLVQICCLKRKFKCIPPSITECLRVPLGVCFPDSVSVLMEDTS